MSKKDLGGYEKTIKNTKRILSYDNELRKCFGGRKNQVKKALQLMEKQLDKLAEDNGADVSEKQEALIERVASLFLDFALTKPLNDFFKDLSLSYLLVVYNWNEATVANSDIRSKVKSTEAIVKGHTRIMHAIEILKKVTQRAKEVSSYEPPSFDLSKHYLKSLQDKSSDRKESKESRQS